MSNRIDIDSHIAFKKMLWDAARVIHPKCKLKSVCKVDVSHNPFCPEELFVDYDADSHLQDGGSYCLDLYAMTVAVYCKNTQKCRRKVKLKLVGSGRVKRGGAQ